jgi:hypothetical protein
MTSRKRRTPRRASARAAIANQLANLIGGSQSNRRSQSLLSTCSSLVTNASPARYQSGPVRLAPRTRFVYFRDSF